MNISVINLDNTTTNYGYSPEHKAHAVGFYTKMFWRKEIKGFTMTHDDGDTVTIGTARQNRRAFLDSMMA